MFLRLVRLAAILFAMPLSGCSDQGSTAPAPVPFDKNSVSKETERAVADEMVRRGTSREDADATTKAIYDAERDFRRRNGS